MKKIILIIVMSLLTSNIFAEKYILVIAEMNYKNAIQIGCDDDLVLNEENHCVNPIPTCESPEVLNEAQDACIDPRPSCESPLVLNEAQDTCINPVLSVGWVYTTGDNCNGMRQANFNPNVYFARSRSSTYAGGLNIPIGYHWVTKSEYSSLFTASNVSTKSNAIHVYYRKCGVSDHAKSITGVDQYVFLFSAGGTSGMHTGNYESHGVSHTTYQAGVNFAGLVLYKD